MTDFGPTGQLVYERTYSRVKEDGTRETWPETVTRVVDGNLALYPDHQQAGEREALIDMMTQFKVIPAGRHLWASGVKGRQYLFNCHVAGWGEDVTEHFEFTFMRLMEGGGVGANYSNSYLARYGEYQNRFTLHIVCDPAHPDYQAMVDGGYISERFVSDWDGAYEVADSREGWAEALTDLITTFYRTDVAHNDRVYDVSRVRSSGSRLKTFGGSASGPLPLARMLHKVVEIMNCDTVKIMRPVSPPIIREDVFSRSMTGLDAMAIDHAIAECVVSGGNRRSARMSIMKWDDPQIMEFIHCKADGGEHWTTNISVEVDNEFWSQAQTKLSKPHAQVVLEEMSNAMLLNGEPGFWNSDISNYGEPNRVVATNPCGEIPLTEWENCNLGHVNLAAFVDDKGAVDRDGLTTAHVLMTRFLMRATYGDVNDPKQAETLARNRRIGVGHLGVASFLAMIGIKYSEAPDSEDLRYLLQFLANVTNITADNYAHDMRIPTPVKRRTVAPTGTIAKMPGVSEGIHPIFARYFLRRVRFSDVDESQRAMVDYYREQGYHTEPCRYAPETTVVTIPTKDSLVEEVERRYGADAADTIVESAADITLNDMLRFQSMYQTNWADNAVSYTVNVDAGKYSAIELAETLKSYSDSLKGATIFPETGMPQAPYERISRADYELYQMTQVADSVDENCVNGCPVK